MQRGGGSGDSWIGSGRPPVVTEQETPPATKKNKSFGFTPTGPTIREVPAELRAIAAAAVVELRFYFVSCDAHPGLLVLPLFDLTSGWRLL